MTQHPDRVVIRGQYWTAWRADSTARRRCHTVGRWGRPGSGAATPPLPGRKAVAQFVLGSTRYLPPDVNVEVVEVNGQPAAILRTDKQAVLLIALEVDQVQVREIRVIGNPGKLRGL